MIKKLKIKLVLLSMSSLFLLLAILVGAMNIINYNSIANDADKILSVISENKGRFPEHKNPKDKKPNKQHSLSPEAPYESRYFSVLIDNEGYIVKTNTSKIKSVDAEKAMEYGRTALNKLKSNGFIDIYRYSKTEDGNHTRITFLDCRKQYDTFYNFMFASISMSAIGYIIVFIIIFIFSGKIIQPISESYEKQKRFITDAGHEIKTPLTIINANTDILEAEKGNCEPIDDIRVQTKRLTELTNELVYLTKMEEENRTEMFEIPLSEVVKESAESFMVLAESCNKTLNTNIEPLLTIKGNIKDISQLTGILLDNAIKYSVENSTINVLLLKQGKYAELSISNTCKSPIDKSKLSKIFDRFYRCDLSRNSETGGYGIGLSIAKAIVQKHAGKIFAVSTEENVFKITILLPM